MKKVLMFLCVLMCAVMMITLSACQNEPAENPTGDNVKETEKQPEETKDEEKPAEPTSADELWALVDGNMENADSYEANITMDMVMYMGGFKIDSKATGFEIFSEGDDYYYYRFLTTDMECDELSLEETQKELVAFNEGTAFISKIAGDKAQNLCSKMTADEFKEYEDGSIDQEFIAKDYTESEFLKNDDGTWSLSFSGYTKKAINGFLKDMGIESDILGADIVDVKISLIADSDYYAKELTLEYIFDVEETDTAVPMLKETMMYSKFNAAERTTTGIELDEYTEVADIRVLKDVEEQIDEFCNLPEAAFTFDMKQESKLDGQTVSTITEKDNISFGKKNGSYVYVADIIYNGQKMNVSYRNGVQTIEINGESQNVPQSEEEAFDYILGVVNSANYDADSISNIVKMSEGVYKLTVEEPDLSAYEAALTGEGMTFKSGTQEIIVTFADGKLKKLESEVNVVAEYSENGNTAGVDMNVLATVTFNTAENGTQAA